MARTLTAALLTTALVCAGQAPAYAQTKEEVDRAESALDDARAGLDLAAEARASVRAALADGLAEYERLNHELSEVGFAAAGLHERIVGHEAGVRKLRDRVEALVVGAYIAGTVDPAAAQLDVAPGPGAVVARRVAAAHSRRGRASIADLSAARVELEGLRGELDAEQARMADLRREVAALNGRLDELFAATDHAVGSALTAVAAADAVYRAALTRYEEEQRRLASLGGVARWQPLVEQYFPAWLVDEALTVMHCESRGNPDATNPHSDAAGLFQFLAGTWRFASTRAGFPAASRYDPEANVAAAAWLVRYSIENSHPWGRWGRWSCRRALG